MKTSTFIIAALVFMALRPASAQDARIMGMFGPGPVGGFGNRATSHQTDPRSVLKRCERAGVLRECEVYLKRRGRR
jgi:hypothetical protein